MDVFNITEQDGNKVTDEVVLDLSENLLGCWCHTINRQQVIELTGCDRPGLLSELTAVLTHLKCSVLNADVWTHNTRAAAVMQVTDNSTSCAISDPERISRIKNLLRNVLKGSNTPRVHNKVLSHREVHTDMRLHQMMFED